MISTRRRLAVTAVTWVMVGAVLRITLLAPERCSPLTPEEAHASAVAAVDWIVTNQQPDGRYLYLYDRETGDTPAVYNLVRHAGTTMSVYQLVEAGETEYLAAADRATDYMLERMIETGPGAGSWAEPGEDLQLGAAALMSTSLLIRRRATNDPRYDDVLRQLGGFMVGQQRPDGVMLERWRLSTAAPDPEQRSRYATGEALWAIAMLHEAFPGEGWDGAAWPILDYIATRRDAEEDLFPRPWPDQWAAYSLAEMVEWGLDDEHTDYARSLAAQFGVQVRWDAQREGIGELTHPPETRGAGFGTVLEGLGMLGRVAAHDERLADLEDAIDERLVCGSARLAARQVSHDEVIGPKPELEVGAWFLGAETRMDDQQHPASGMLWAEQVLSGRKP